MENINNKITYTPTVKKAIQKYVAKPDVKEKLKIYQREYHKKLYNKNKKEQTDWYMNTKERCKRRYNKKKPTEMVTE